MAANKYPPKVVMTTDEDWKQAVTTARKSSNKKTRPTLHQERFAHAFITSQSSSSASDTHHIPESKFYPRTRTSTSFSIIAPLKLHGHQDYVPVFSSFPLLRCCIAPPKSHDIVFGNPRHYPSPVIHSAEYSCPIGT